MAAETADERVLPVPHRISRDVEHMAATGVVRYPVTTLDRVLVLGYIERALMPAGIVWRPLAADGERLPEHARTLQDGAVVVARSEQAHAAVAVRDARRARVRKQGSLPSCIGWYVAGPGVAALPEAEQPGRFRTRAAAIAWAETHGLLLTR